MEEIQKLKRSRLILSIGLLLQGTLYGILIVQLILRINRIYNMVILLIDAL